MTKKEDDNKKKKVKCTLAEEEMRENIQKALDGLEVYRCYHSKDIIDCYKNKKFNTEWICDVFLYDSLKKTLDKLESIKDYLKIKIHDTIYESEEAYHELENFMICRYLNNMITTLSERIRCEELDFLWNELRFSSYDYSMNNTQIDQKDIKIKNTQDFKYSYQDLKDGDSEELTRIAIHYIDNQKNKDNDVSKMCKNIHYNIYADERDDMLKLLRLQMDFDFYREFCRELALSKVTSMYAFDVEVKGYIFHITMNVFFTE